MLPCSSKQRVLSSGNLSKQTKSSSICAVPLRPRLSFRLWSVCGPVMWLGRTLRWFKRKVTGLKNQLMQEVEGDWAVQLLLLLVGLEGLSQEPRWLLYPPVTEGRPKTGGFLFLFQNSCLFLFKKEWLTSVMFLLAAKKSPPPSPDTLHSYSTNCTLLHTHI